MTTKPLLSICIPTYNRAHYVKRCLTNLVEQFTLHPMLRDGVEVVVSDNASTDDTETVVRSFAKMIPRLTYHKNQENVGFDRNIVAVVTEASGTFCWYLGDDDLIVPGALKVVYDKFATGTYDLITMNSLPLWKNGDITPQNYTPAGFVELQDHNEFYFRVYCQGGVSVLAFRRDLWLQVLTTDDYLEHWLYYETVLKVLAQSTKPKLFISTPVVATGQDCRWAENGTELFTFINSNRLRRKAILFGFNKERLEQEIQEGEKKLPIVLLRAKGHGLDCTYKNWLFITKHTALSFPSLPRLFLCAMIYVLPNPFVRQARNFRKSLTRFKI